MASIISIYPSVSADTSLINNLFFWFILIAAIILIAIISSLTYIIIRFSRNKMPFPLSQNEGNDRLEIGIILISFTLVMIFLVYTVKSMFSIQPPITYNNPDLIIIGHQWWWEIIYPKDGFTTANELHVPAGKKLLVQLSSADVIHDWWVPAMGRKMDLIPGQNNYFYIEAVSPGIYYGTCSEFCGRQHAWMRIKVFADNPLNYTHWVAHQKRPANHFISGIAKRGKELFESKTCGNCHQIKGNNANESIGPDLTHFASRTTLFAGKKEYSFENIQKWIANPQSEKPGANMPDFMLSDDEVHAIATYLYQLN